MDNGLEFDAAATMNAYTSGKGGIKVKNKKSATDDKPVDRMRVRGLAATMAKESYSAKIKREGTNDPYGLSDPSAMINAYVPTPEDIARFEPEAQAYLYGKAPEAAAPKKKATKADPLDNIGDLGDTSSLWDLLK